MVQVTVNYIISNEVFTVHKELLCFHSTHFDKALGQASTKQASQSAQCYGDPVIFGHFVNWMYREKLVCPGDEDKDGEPLNHCTFVEIWLLAARLGVPRLQNAVIDELFCMAYQTSHDMNSALELIYPPQFGSKVSKAMIACAASMPDLTLNEDNIIETRVLVALFSEVQRQNVKLKAGEQVLPPQASDFYILTDESIDE